jgi:hypothetical protein
LKIYFGFENIERILKEKENTILHGITKNVPMSASKCKIFSNMCVFPKRFHTSTQIHAKTIHIGDFVLPAALVQGALGSSPGQQPLQAALQQGTLTGQLGKAPLQKHSCWQKKPPIQIT